MNSSIIRTITINTIDIDTIDSKSPDDVAYIVDKN